MSRRVKIIETSPGVFLFRFGEICSNLTHDPLQLAAQIEAVTSADETWYFFDLDLEPEEELGGYRLEFQLDVGVERRRLRALTDSEPETLDDYSD